MLAVREGEHFEQVARKFSVGVGKALKIKRSEFPFLDASAH